MAISSTATSLASETAGSSPELTRPAPNAERRQQRERRRALLRALRRSLLGLAIGAAALTAALALRPRPVPVDVARARFGSLEQAIQESGVTRVKDRYVVSAPVSGHLSRITLEVGDAVAAGDTLYEIAPASSPLLDQRARSEAEARLGAALSALGQARAQVARAEAAKQLADLELGRARKLANTDSLTPQALDQASFSARMRTEELSSADFASKIAAEEVRVARVTLGLDGGRTAQQHVDVLSPIAGRVLRIQQQSAGVVAAGTPLIELGDPAALEVVVDLLTTDAVQVQPGAPVSIEGWGGDHPLSARVRRIEPSGFTRPSALGVDEQRVNALLLLTEPRERWTTLGDGYRVQARLVLWRAERVLQIPQGALFRSGNSWTVFRNAGGVVRLTPVVIGHRGDTQVEVLSGLRENDEVVVHPGDRVKDGVRVDVR